MSARSPVRARLTVLCVLAAGGLACYLPVLRLPPTTSVVLVLAGTVLLGLGSYAGLRWADGTALPMPWLRRLDGGPRPERANLRGVVSSSVLGGALFGVTAVAVLRHFELPNLDAPRWVRALTTPFAAIDLELVIHLFAMSGLVRLTHSRSAALLGSTLLFVLFHAAGAVTQPWPILASVLAMNAGLGLFLGGSYLRYGLESVFLGHATAHLIAVTWG